MTQAQEQRMETPFPKEIERVPTNTLDTQDKKRKNPKNEPKKKKKRGSSLAFWFCMSGKTDTLDKDAQPYPQPKSKSKGKQESSKSPKRSASNEDDRKQTKGKHHHRHSAPPAEWLSVVSALQKEDPNLRLNQDPHNRSMSPSSGVRYRFDGTLEKPYVYPGGLTFKGEAKKKKKEKKPSKRSSKKGNKVVEAEVHQTNGKFEGQDVVYESDGYEDSDIRKHFYLKYDSHIRKKRSTRREDRYSMPADLHSADPDSLGKRYGRGGAKWVEQDGVDNVSLKPKVETEGAENEEEDYDEPYESETEFARRPSRRDEARPNSYYSRPLQSNEWVYMWHSCEDLTHCNAMYHSEDEMRGSRELLPHKSGGCDVDIQNIKNTGNRIEQNESPSLKYTQKCAYSNSDNADLSYGPEISYKDASPNKNKTTASNPSQFSGTPRNRDLSDKECASNGTPSYEKNSNFDSPFKRNAGRSSCMPGNKRFVLPPPPTYTPPREEFEIARVVIARKGREEKNSCTRGSQADLTEESKEELMDMIDRDQSLTHCDGDGEVFVDNEKANVAINSCEKFSSPVHIIKGNLKVLHNTPSPVVNDNVSDNAIHKDNSIGKNKSGSDLQNSSSKQTTSDDFVDEKVEYANFPKQSQSTVSSTSDSSSRDHSRASYRRQAVVTSTPKSQRKSELKLRPPIPTPRHRFSSCFEYSTETFVSSVKDSLYKAEGKPSETPSQSLAVSSKSTQNEGQGDQPTPLSSVPAPKQSQPKEKPVAKKRRSQLTNSDSSYTAADIEEGLRDCDKDSPNTARRELFSCQSKTLPEESEMNNNSVSKTGIPEVVEEEDESKSSSRNNISRTSLKSTREANENTTTNCSASKIPLPPLRRLELARSPTTTRRPYSFIFSSSAECLMSPLTKTYYSGLSSSLADLHARVDPSSFQPLAFDFRPTTDDDDHDDENADDEMSVHNEESPLPKTASLEDLLRARSILDRSQAIARKRRQRMRDRKCRSQILSSTEVDDYYKHDIVRKRPSRHSSKQNHVTDSASNPVAAPTAVKEDNPQPVFSMETPSTSIPTPSRRALQRQHKFLNHTDSGMDSDGTSPLNSRELYQGREHSPQFVNWLGDGGVDGKEGSGDLGTLTKRKSWEARFYERQGLRKYRSKEHLAYSDNVSQFDKRISVSNGFETLV